MTQISILQGIYTDNNSDFRVAYPINLIPIGMQNGLSAGYFRPAHGIKTLISHDYGVCRGLINWDSILYGVFGSNLYKINYKFEFELIGSVENDNKLVRFAYGVDKLAIASNKSLFFYDESNLKKVQDSDLGEIIDIDWVDSFFLSTDGQYIIAHELTDPSQIDPLKYGSSEASPDPIFRLIRIRNEIYAVNRYTMELFNNVGSEGFPFQRVEGAQIQKGALGSNCVCKFKEAIAFIGSAEKEAPSVYLGSNGSHIAISTRTIDLIINSYPEKVLSDAILESRLDKGQEFLYIHLPDKTLVFDAKASDDFKTLVWHVLQSTLESTGQYLANNFTYVYDKWVCTHKTQNKLGYLVENISSHWELDVKWEFSTGITYNQSMGVIFHELELLCLTGRVALGAKPEIYTQYSNDGMKWSMQKKASVGTIGDTIRKVCWLGQGHMRRWRIQKFSGTSEAFVSFARLEARLEALNV